MANPPGTNSADAGNYLTRLEALYDEIDRIKGESFAQAKEYHRDIKDLYNEAENNGVSVEALKAVIKYRKLERKLMLIRDNLEDAADQAVFDVLIDQFGAKVVRVAERTDGDVDDEIADDGEDSESRAHA